MIAIFTIILELLGVMAKNPLVQKVLLVGLFYTSITTAITFFLSKFTVNVGLLGSVLNLACYLGFIDGLNVFLSFLITGFIVKQILAFIRS
jgi:hypothetical protein